MDQHDVIWSFQAHIKKWPHQNMTLMKVPHCTVEASKTPQLAGSILGMAINPIMTKGNIIKPVIKTATLPTIDKPLQKKSCYKDCLYLLILQCKLKEHIQNLFKSDRGFILMRPNLGVSVPKVKHLSCQGQCELCLCLSVSLPIPEKHCRWLAMRKLITINNIRQLPIDLNSRFQSQLLLTSKVCHWRRGSQYHVPVIQVS